MHTSELVELAAVVSTQGPALIHGKSRPATAAIEQYWLCSRRRLDRWSLAIRRYVKDAASSDRELLDARWPLTRAVFDEVLTGEILTRVFAAVMSAYDRQHGSNIVEPAAQSILIGHLESRHHVLTILAQRLGLTSEQATTLNQLRRTTERWSDMLVGYLAAHVEIDEFAVEGDRAGEFAEDLSHKTELKNGSNAWELVKASVRTAFGCQMGSMAANADLNERIAQGVVACFDTDQFESTGKFQSLWMTRLWGAADETQNLIDKLAAEVQCDG